MPRYPFTPEVLDSMPEPLAKLFRGLEDTLLIEICKRLKKAGELNEVTVEAIRALRSHGIDLKEIEEAISSVTEIGEKELNKLLDDVISRYQNYAKEMLTIAAITTPKLMINDVDVEAIRKQALSEYRNITRSMGFVGMSNSPKVMSALEAYQWALDQAELEIMSGAIDYNSAIRKAVKGLADSGLKTVDWESGHRDQVDVSVRRAVMSSINRMNTVYMETLQDDLETDLVEVTAHAGARNTGYGIENHASWQGKVYRWSKKPKTSKGKYKDFELTTGFGQGAGLGGWNCYHRYYPYIEGVSYRTYTDEDLNKIDKPPFAYQGKEYNQYEASQEQRRVERTLRKLRREAKAYEAAALSEDAQAVNIRIKRLRKYYDAFSKKAGLPTQYERAAVTY